MSLRDAAVAANRFGLGARPGELEEVARDPRGWLDAQLEGTDAPAELSGLPALSELVVGTREALSAGGRDGKQALDDALKREQAAALTAAARGDRPLRERLVAFWSNHLAISARDNKTAALAGAYERQAIRPRVTGRFEELLTAATQHPAMLVYLDNRRSIGPDSPMGQRGGQGMNENLGRELLELHTVGVGAGYSQADVEAMAALLTGWRVSKDGAFSFTRGWHQPGEKVVLGRRYGEGLEEGERALRELARHPATARRVCSKLAQHFVSDAPPEALVAAMEGAWVESGGELARVYRALLDHPAAWAPQAAKYKSPRDLVLSSARALDPEGAEGRALLASLETLGQPPWSPESQAGYGDTAERWLSPDAVLRRVEWCSAVASALPEVDPRDLGEQVLGPQLERRTRGMLAASATAQEGLALLLASPEFQRR